MTLPTSAAAFLGSTPSHSLIEGFQAGLDCGARQEAFTENMSAVVDPSDVDENARSAFAQINEDTRTEFATNKNALQLQQHAIDFSQAAQELEALLYPLCSQV
ncbi:hypothetical protein OBB00_08575 [Gammaproteobacteria bacterium]|nr:hypothetical protein [Gammaproteobacteria bacterium]